jgi:hypothetical protein
MRGLLKSQLKTSKSTYSKRKSIIDRSIRLSEVEQLKMFVESLGLNPNEVLSKDALVTPHCTVVESEQRKIEMLNQP